MKIFAFVMGALAAIPAGAQELVTLSTRPGVTQSFFIANMGARKPEAIALLFVGGGGAIELRKVDGKLRFQQGNFLPRSRREFIRNGVLPVILDAPSDHAQEMPDRFRMSDAHVLDIRAVVAELKKRYPDLPVFLVGTSRGTTSVAHLSTALGGEAKGAVLTSSHFYHGDRRNPSPQLAAFDWRRARMPLLFVHHVDDGCWATPHRAAARLAAQFPVIEVRGGKPDESGPCDPLSAHGYFGREAETVDAITAWMLGTPYRRNIQ